jgi:serine/threonine-protein kinase HipA
MPEMTIREPNVLQLRFLGLPMATLAQRGDPPEFALAFEPEFLETGHDLSPLRLPRESLTSRPFISREGTTPFPGGLPGLIADSLPDSWGRRMQQLAYPGLKTLLGRFAAVGMRGPGAITIEPVLDASDEATSVNLARIAEEAARLAKAPAELTKERIDEILVKVSSGLGGAQPKATVHLPAGGPIINLHEVLVGGQPPTGYSSYILKFSPRDDEGGGSTEYAFTVMARRAGLNVAQGCLIHDGERRHFATERFDRIRHHDGSFGRRHVHTLSGMLHQRASDAGIDYEDFIRLSRRLIGIQGAEECFRRAVFHLLSTNRDDHGRNHAFIYDDAARLWDLSPAYDLNPNVSTVLIGLSWLHSLEIPQAFLPLRQLAEIGGIAYPRALEIYAQVNAAVSDWPTIASDAGVPLPVAEIWQQDMLQQTRALRADADRQSRPPHRRSVN